MNESKKTILSKVSLAAAMLGSMTSERKKKSSAENGRRPKKNKNKT